MMTAIYPGSFDPITLGHIDIIERAARCFDRLYVCVMINADKKNPMFTPEERMEFVKKAVARFENVQAESWQGLLTDYAAQKGATVLVKGARNVCDFDNEYQMSLINRSIKPDLETLILPASAPYSPFQFFHGPGNDPLPAAAGAVSSAGDCGGCGEDRRAETYREVINHGK